MKLNLLAVAAILLSCTHSAFSADKDTVYVDLQQDKVIAFVDEMVEQHDFDREALRKILAQAEIKASIIKKISTPAERRLTWGEYRAIFITDDQARIKARAQHSGARIAKCWNASQLESGVPIEILVGIIGVETYFGRITGNDRVIDALANTRIPVPAARNFFSQRAALTS